MPPAEDKSLRSYLGVLRRRWMVLAVVIPVAAGVGLALALTSDEVYKAEASIRSKDPTESAPLGGVLPAQGELPQQTSAQTAETVTTPSVLTQVKRRLNLSDSLEALKTRIEVAQDQRSNLITIGALAPTAAEAQDLANVVAQTATVESNDSIRARYREQANRLAARAEALENGPSTPLSSTVRTRRQKLVTTAASLEALSEVTVVSEVAQAANLPQSPESPQPLKETGIAAAVGLGVAVILIVLVEALDRRLRRPEEAQELLDLSLVGVVPETAMGGVPMGGEAVAEQAAAMDMFRMIRTSISYLNVDESPRLVLVTSPVPEEGKTTVSIGVALAAAASGRRTLLLEADLRRPVHADRLGLKASPGLVELLTQEASPDQVRQELDFEDPSIVRSTNGSEPRVATLVCVTAGRVGGWSAELLGSARFATFLEQAKAYYDLVVIDSPPILAAAETLEIVPAVDAVLLCARLGRTTIEQARVGREALERLPARPTGLVVTGLRSGARGDGYAYYAYAYDYRYGRSASGAR
jgi:capsular exopolysaccharide synthesis family protein